MTYEQMMNKKKYSIEENHTSHANRNWTWPDKNLVILYDIQRNSKPKYLIRTLKATMLITMAQQAIEYQVAFYI